MVDVQDIYRGIIKPGAGGIYAPGPPVMLPPQGVAAITRALIASDPTGNAPSWDQFDDQVNDPSSAVRTADQIRGIVPGANGTIVADKSQDQLQPSNPANAFAYGAPAASAPAAAAIAAATQPRDPFVPLQGFGSAFTGGWGSDAFSLLPDGMPVDSAVPLNAAQYPANFGGAPVAPAVSPAAVAAALLASRPGPMAGVAAAAPGTYDPNVDVTGVLAQENRGPAGGRNTSGWGINAGGGIVI